MNVFLEKTQKSASNCLVPIENEIKKIDKDGNKDIATVSYKMKFMDRAKFIASFLSNLVDKRNSYN